MNQIEPDSLLEKTNRSIFGKAVVVSLVGHLQLCGLTSFGIYKDWGAYGFHSPSTIKMMKKTAEKEQAEKARQEAAAARATQEAVAAKAAAANAPAAGSDGGAQQPAVKPDASGAAAPAPAGADSATVKEPEIAPLPRAKSFDLNSVNLDD